MTPHARALSRTPTRASAIALFILASSPACDLIEEEEWLPAGDLACTVVEKGPVAKGCVGCAVQADLAQPSVLVAAEDWIQLRITFEYGSGEFWHHEAREGGEEGTAVVELPEESKRWGKLIQASLSRKTRYSDPVVCCDEVGVCVDYDIVWYKVDLMTALF